MTEQDEAVKTIDLAREPGETNEAYTARASREVAKHPYGTVVKTTYEFNILPTPVQVKKNSSVSSAVNSCTTDI